MVATNLVQLRPPGKCGPEPFEEVLALMRLSSTLLTHENRRFEMSRERKWHTGVDEQDHRNELFLLGRPDYIAAYARVERRSENRVESITIWSAPPQLCECRFRLISDVRCDRPNGGSGP